MRAFLHQQTEACINNLQGIRIAKRLWAAEHKKTSSDTPDVSALIPYIYIRGFRCPSEGWYTFSDLSWNPDCTLGAWGHIIPDSP
jgi:hypothetical protein